jgi:hypothetical protein
LELINHAKRPGERIPTGKNNLEIKKKKKLMSSYMSPWIETYE